MGRIWKEIFCNTPTQLLLQFFEKNYQKKWKNAYLTFKNAGASTALRWALDPANIDYICKSQKILLAPPLDQILNPILIRPLFTIVGACKHMCEGQLKRKFSIQKLFN